MGEPGTGASKLPPESLISKRRQEGETKPELEILQGTDFRGGSIFFYKSRTTPKKEHPFVKNNG